jgi:alcohol dehydrogenase
MTTIKTISFLQYTVPEIIFGVGKFALLPNLIVEKTSKVLIVKGKSSFDASPFAAAFYNALTAGKVQFQQVSIEGEPSPNDVDEAVSKYRQWQPGLVVAIGGGSAIDAGKAISAMLCETGSIADYLEGVGEKTPSGNKIPFVAVPTTSGTGSEATMNAVITRQGPNGFKKSLRHKHYLPNIALVDPLLSVACSPLTTAASGLDALTQLLEAFLSTNSNAYTDALAFDGLEKILNHIEMAVTDGNNTDARAAMSYGAMVSGIVLANAGLGVVHGFAQPLGSLFPIPHGVVCANLIGAANRVTVKIAQQQNNQALLDKYERVAGILFKTGNQGDRIERLLNHFDKLLEKFKLPLLSAFGISDRFLPEIIAQTGLKNHPIRLTHNDLEQIVKQRI